MCARCSALDVVPYLTNIEVYPEAEKPAHVREIAIIKLSDGFSACCPLCSFLLTILSINDQGLCVSMVSATDMNETVIRDNLLQDQCDPPTVGDDAESSIEVEYLRYNESWRKGWTRYSVGGLASRS
jgi:hypothetical protein